MPSIDLPSQSSRWRIPSWSASTHTMWYYQYHSPCHFWHDLYQWYSRLWYQSQHWTEGCDIPHSCWKACLPPRKDSVLQSYWYVYVLGQVCMQNNLALFWCPAITVAIDVVIIYRKACVQHVYAAGFHDSITLVPFDYHFQVLFWATRNCQIFVVVVYVNSVHEDLH